MANGYGTWGYRLDQIADAIWQNPTRGLTEQADILQTAANKVWSSPGRALSGDVGITQAGADKVWGSGNRALTTLGTLETVASNNARLTVATVRTLAGTTSLQKFYAARVAFPGVYRLTVELKNTSGTGTMAIFKNGVQATASISPDDTFGSTYAAKTCDIAALPGDVLEVWVRNTTTVTISGQNFKLSCDYQYKATPGANPVLEV